MPAYLVTRDLTKGAQVLFNGADAAVVFAADAAAAKEICQSMIAGANAAWSSDVTVTEIVADADWNGWVFTIGITGGTVNATVTYTGDATTNLIDEMGAKLVIECNAVTGIAGSAYNTTTQVLKVAETTDGIGDHAIVVSITPPGGDSSVGELVGTIVDEGSSGDLLSVILPADAAVIPIVTSFVKQA